MEKVVLAQEGGGLEEQRGGHPATRGMAGPTSGREGTRKPERHSILRAQKQALGSLEGPRDEKEAGEQGRSPKGNPTSASGNFPFNAALPRLLQGRGQPCTQVSSTRKDSDQLRWEDPRNCSSLEAAAVCRELSVLLRIGRPRKSSPWITDSLGTAVASWEARLCCHCLCLYPHLCWKVS